MSLEVVATLPYLIYNKVKENWMNLICKVVFSCSPIAAIAQQGEKREDVRPMFSLAYWETDAKGFCWLIFQPAGIVIFLLADIENNNEKN